PAVNHDSVFFCFDAAIQLAVRRVELEQISKAVGREQIVHGHDFDILVRHRRAEKQATDAAKSVDTDFQGHAGFSLCARLANCPACACATRLSFDVMRVKCPRSWQRVKMPKVNTEIRDCVVEVRRYDAPCRNTVSCSWA